MRSVLVISDRDNVATALEALEPGRSLDINGATVTVRDPIPRGHKVALIAIAAGSPVIKYGSSIGTASADIVAGGHVHTHNVSSSRGRGDLEAERPGSPELPRAPEPPSSRASEAAQARLAEPPDERNGANGRATP